jgi:hypothetical protein
MRKALLSQDNRLQIATILDTLGSASLISRGITSRRRRQLERRGAWLADDLVARRVDNPDAGGVRLDHDIVQRLVGLRGFHVLHGVMDDTVCIGAGAIRRDIDIGPLLAGHDVAAITTAARRARACGR